MSPFVTTMENCIKMGESVMVNGACDGAKTRQQEEQFKVVHRALLTFNEISAIRLPKTRMRTFACELLNTHL